MSKRLSDDEVAHLSRLARIRAPTIVGKKRIDRLRDEALARGQRIADLETGILRTLGNLIDAIADCDGNAPGPALEKVYDDLRALLPDLPTDDGGRDG